MTDYLESISTFYNEKIKYASHREKYLFCKGCETYKQFIEKDGKLFFMCGEGKGDCGVQMEIELPTYLHYETEMDKLDKEKETHENFEVMNKYIDVSKELKQQNEQNEKWDKVKKHLEEIFTDENIRENEKKLQSFYDSRKKKTKRCQDIQKILKKENLPELKKQELRREYVTNTKEMRDEYITIQKLVEKTQIY